MKSEEVRERERQERTRETEKREKVRGIPTRSDELIIRILHSTRRYLKQKIRSETKRRKHSKKQ